MDNLIETANHYVCKLRDAIGAYENALARNRAARDSARAPREYRTQCHREYLARRTELLVELGGQPERIRPSVLAGATDPADRAKRSNGQ
jgi:hypothetical protein